MNQLQNSPTCMIDHLRLDPVYLKVFSLQNEMNVFRQDYAELPIRGNK